jgi:uncharacterized protein (TIGR00730 family)
MRQLRRIGVFCGSTNGIAPVYAAAASALGRALAHRRCEVVLGGAASGLMGAVARACRRAGGRVTAIVLHDLVPRERASGAAHCVVGVDSPLERKAKLCELADGFIALPGGLGTFEEIFEVFATVETGHLDKPLGLLDTRGYFEALRHLVLHGVREGFIPDRHAGLLLAQMDPEALLEAMERYEPPAAGLDAQPGAPGL